MLKELIARDAKLVCKFLENRKSLTITELKELTEYQEFYIYIVVGWLSKESKIIYLDADDNDLCIALN